MRRSILIAHPGADLYGSDRVMLGSVQALQDRGWQVVVSLPAPGPLVGELEALGAEVEYCRTAVLRKSVLTPRGMIGWLIDLVCGIFPGIKLIRSSRAQIIYVSTLTLPLWFVLARLLGRPVVCHLHEAERKASKTVRRLLSAPLFLVNRVIANSDFTKNVLVDTFARLDKRTVVIHNGVPSPILVLPPREDLSDPLRLLFIGRLSPRKGPQVAVEVVRELGTRGQSCELDIVGSVFPGYEWFEAELRDRVARAALQSKIRFHGFLEDVSSVIADCDVVLVPSQADESFGNIAVEALLANRPVIVSDNSGLAEAVAGYRSALTVEPESIVAWTEAVLQLRAGWMQFSADAALDAAEASRRHAPSKYRQQISDLLVDLISSVSEPQNATTSE